MSTGACVSQYSGDFWLWLWVEQVRYGSSLKTAGDFYGAPLSTGPGNVKLQHLEQGTRSMGGPGVGECWSWICRSGARSRQHPRQQTAYLSSMQMSVLSLLTPTALAGCLPCTACLGRNLFRRSCLGRSVNFFLVPTKIRASNRDLLFSVMLFKALAPR